VGEAARTGPYPDYFAVLQYIALITTLLTAFYTFRAYFLTFWGKTRIPDEAGHHPHESPSVMTWPLMVLAACAACVGIALGPTHQFFHCLSHSPGFGGAPPHELSGTVAATGTLLGLIGVAIAWWFYVRRPGSVSPLATQFPRAYQLSLREFFLDASYDRLIVRPAKKLAFFCNLFDKLAVDRAVDGVGNLPALVGKWMRYWQTGLIQNYAAMMFLGVTMMIVLILLMN
jgi:NADH-quinone oxidoreductase subunit L